MRTAGVVCEYNPFHNGHAFHLKQTRKMGFEAIVAVMSGNLVQRAEPAAFSKWARAKAAVASGADLVLELPVPYVLSSAEGFAMGAVGLLDSLGIINAVSFGSECGDKERIFRCAQAVLKIDGSPAFKRALGQYPFPIAREKAVEELFGKELSQLLRCPNDILGVEYCKALLRLSSDMEPAAVKRRGAGHDLSRPEDGYASASCLRGLLKKGESIEAYVPKEAQLFYQEEREIFGPQQGDALDHLILYALAAAEPEKLRKANGMSEGLHNRLRREALRSSSLDELYQRVQTRRYPASRIRRAAVNGTLGISKVDFPSAPPYIRVLDFNETGRQLLKEIKSAARLPLYHSFAKLKGDFPYFGQKEELADKLFAASFAKKIEMTEYRHNRLYSVNPKYL